MPGRPDTRRSGVLIYPQAEVLDITGPHEVFSMALAFQGQQQARLHTLRSLFDRWQTGAGYHVIRHETAAGLFFRGLSVTPGYPRDSRRRGD